MVAAVSLFFSTAAAVATVVIFFSRSTAAYEYEFFLAAMLTELNEQDTILEFMQHYLEEGVEHVFIFDDGSTDDTLLRLKCIDDRYYTVYTKQDLYPPINTATAAATATTTTATSAPVTKQVQMEYYDRMYNYLGVRWRAKWLIKADADEYISSRAYPHLSIRDIILQFYDNNSDNNSNNSNKSSNCGAGEVTTTTATTITTVPDSLVTTNTAAAVPSLSSPSSSIVSSSSSSSGRSSFTCDVLSIPWLIFSWGEQQHDPVNSARYSLQYRWSFDERFAMTTDSSKFRNRHEAVENKVIFRTSEVESSFSLHTASFRSRQQQQQDSSSSSSGNDGGGVCIPHSLTHLHCADATVDALIEQQQQQQLLLSSPDFATAESSVQTVNDLRVGSKLYFDPNSNGIYRDPEGNLYPQLPRWCPPNLRFRAVESPLWLRLQEADINNLILATFHYRVRSWDDWKRKIDPNRRRSSKYVGHERAANRVDVFDDFMLSTRQLARQNHSSFRSVQKMLQDCPLEYFSA